MLLLQVGEQNFDQLGKFFFCVLDVWTTVTFSAEFLKGAVVPLSNCENLTFCINKKIWLFLGVCERGFLKLISLREGFKKKKYKKVNRRFTLGGGVSPNR